MDLSIVVPVYNERKTIKEVIKKLQALPLETKIILVDDGSTDGTRAILEKYTNEENTKIVFQPENGGKGAALREGFYYIEGEYTVVQDADLEYEPQDLVKMYEYAKETTASVVYGNRFWKKGKPENMAWGNYIFNLISAKLASFLFDQCFNDVATCYKMFRTDFLKVIPLSCEGFEFCPEVTAKVKRRGIKIHEVPISYTPRTIGEGKKIRAWHGINFLWTLVKYKIF